MSEKKNIKDLNDHEKKLYVLEALLRRISLVDMPFVLKGSLLTRQFLDNQVKRNVVDIDFLYADKIHDTDDAEEIFTDWMIQATELDLDDGVLFESFRKNEYWESIDYAMADDFPTTSTDIGYHFKDELGEDRPYQYLSLDVSFNLEMEIEPVPLDYISEFFGNFLVPRTTPLSIQVAWKLHQTIVRPRIKDLYDLQYLLSHASYDKQALSETLQAIVNECSFDRSITNSDIKRVLVDDLYNLYHLLRCDYDLNQYARETPNHIYFKQLATDLRKIMDDAGINQTAFENLPKPN